MLNVYSKVYGIDIKIQKNTYTNKHFLCLYMYLFLLLIDFDAKTHFASPY